MLDPQQILTQRFTDALAKAFGEEFAGTDPLIRPAQNPKFGDYQANVAMSLAKRLKKNPREVASEIIDALEIEDLCDKPEVAGRGFINLKLTLGFISQLVSQLAEDDRCGVDPDERSLNVVVDYSAPNVAKEMHVGHLRSTVIGDALVRTLEFLGHQVTRQNHIGDWGTQFGMLIEYLVDKGVADDENKMAIGDLNTLYREAKQKFDSNEDFADRARKRVVTLQAGDQMSVKLWRRLVHQSTIYFGQLYDRMNVTLTASDVRGESFYNEFLGDVVTDLESRNLARESEGAICVFPEGFKGQDDEPLAFIIRKSDGGYLYATTDLAALRYRINELNAHRVIYVTDARQSQHFAMLFKTVADAGWLKETKAEHVPFGTVLGEDKRPFKTREGGTIRLADLLDEAVERAHKPALEKHPDLPKDQLNAIATAVGIGAVKYADLSGDRIKDYVFSWNRMLALEGNTAPYLQYVYARIRSIFRKADAQPESSIPADALAISHPAERALVVKLFQFGSVVRRVSDTLEPHHLCGYVYELSTAFNTFYQNPDCRVNDADTPEQKRTRLCLCDLTARSIKQGLDLLGIGVVEQM